MERAKELFEKIKSEGKSAIEEFILTRKAEELFLDFKRSADNGNGPRLNQIDRNSLAKSISGFGNSEGGIIIWGVDCSEDFDGADVAKAERPITNVKRFVSWLEGAISGCTIPPHTGVQNHPLETDTGGNGFVVTYIPKSESTPHQEIKSRRYYIRAGSDFFPTPHDVLAGMFGRRPQPKVRKNFHFWPLKINRVEKSIIIPLGFHLFNDGPGIALDLFVSIHFLAIPGPNCRISYEKRHTDFKDYKSYDFFYSLISNPDLRLPPGGTLLPFSIEIILSPPFEKKLCIKGIFGFGNAQPLNFAFENSARNVQSWYEQIFPILETPKYDDKKRIEILNELLGIQSDE